jgi:hypothetical protein
MQNVETPERPAAAAVPRVPSATKSSAGTGPAPRPQLAESVYAEGNRLLRADDQAMAIAKFLDAADLRHAMGAFKAALMYFTGAGITRNTGEAAKLARLCLELNPPSHVAEACREILSDSLGTQNAVRFLLEDDADLALAAEARQGRKKLLVAGSGVVAVLAVAAVVAVVSWDRKRSELDAPSAAGTAALISATEAEESRKAGLALIAGLKAAATTAQQAAPDAAAQRKNDF